MFILDLHWSPGFDTVYEPVDFQKISMLRKSCYLQHLQDLGNSFILCDYMGDIASVKERK